MTHVAIAFRGAVTTTASAQRSLRRLGVFAIAALLTGPMPAVVMAQGGAPISIPGLVVTTAPAQPGPPPGSAPIGQPIVAAPPPQAPPSAAAPAKPKPQPQKKTAKAATSASDADPSAAGGMTIVALVNDEPITAYEVRRRSAFMALSGDINDRARARMKAIAEDPKTNERLRAILDETIKSNPGKSKEQIIAAFEERKKAFVMSLQKQAVEGARASLVPTFRKKALDELIEERLKLQEAKKLAITVADDEVEKQFKGLADRNKMTSEQFAVFIKNQGADAADMKARFKASMAWRDVVRKRYGHHISISQRDVERVLTQGGKGEENVELQLQKMTLAAPGKIDQKLMAQRLDEAEAIRAKFSGCKSTSALAKSTPNVQFEDIGYKSVSSLSEPTRSLALHAKDGEMLPPTLTGAGAEIYAVCGRRTTKINEEKRAQAENELQMKEFERLAQRHLYDLKKDALIEMR